MPLPEALRALPLEYLHEEGIAVGQAHREKRPHPQLPRLLHQGVTEVHLRLPGAVLQRHEHFPPPRTQLCHLLLDRRIAPLVVLLPA